MTTRRDIETRDDCEQLARAFYEKAFADERLGPVFVDVAQLDLESHLPRITDFWESRLLGATSYGGGAFAPHFALHQLTPLTPELFNRWLVLWFATVDERHARAAADTAKDLAQRVATAFSANLARFDSMA